MSKSAHSGNLSNTSACTFIVALTQVEARLDRPNSHLLHVQGDRVAPNLQAFVLPLLGDLTRAEERMLRVDFVYASFERRFYSQRGLGLIVQTGVAQ